MREAPSKSRSVHLYLIVPPVWELSFQSVGIPALSAYCRKHGISVVAVDLNIDFNRWVCGGSRLDLKVLREAYEVIRNHREYRESYELRTDDHKVRIDLPFGFGQIVCNNYSRIADFVGDRHLNPFVDYFRDHALVRQIASAPPERLPLVGLGWDGENQVSASLTLARELKRRNANILTVVGGPWATAMIGALSSEGKLLADIDFIIPKKAELPLLHLVEAIEAADGRPQTDIPGVARRTGDRFSPVKPVTERLPAAELPRPDLFPLNQYRRHNVLPYESERGCYWGQCKFCHHILTYTHNHQSKPIEKVIAEIQRYRQEQDFEVVAFVDAAMPPKRVNEIANAFIDHAMNLRWAGFCRAEKTFTPDIFARAQQSGLDVLSFGVETASRRLLKFIGKPQDSDAMRRVLRDCHDAGIYTTAGIMNGLPSETMEDLDELMSFLDTIKDFTYLHPHMFKFERGSDFFENAKEYNLEVVANPPESRLSIYHDFVDHNGGNTREHISLQNVNQNWWRTHMARTLDWKNNTKGFCKAVNFIVDH